MGEFVAQRGETLRAACQSPNPEAAPANGERSALVLALPVRTPIPLLLLFIIAYFVT